MTKESFVLIIPGCFKTFPRCQSIRTGTEIFCPTGYVWRNNCQVDGQIIMLIFLVNREAILHGPYKRRDGTADPKPGICSSCASSRTGARASTCHQLAAWLQLFPKLMPPVSRWRLLRGNKKKADSITVMIPSCTSDSCRISAHFNEGGLCFGIREETYVSLSLTHSHSLPTLHTHSACAFPLVLLQASHLAR